MKRWMIEDSTEPSTNRIKFILDGVQATTDEFAQWIRDLKAERDNALLQIEASQKRLKEIVQSEDTTRMTGEQILMGYNAHKDLARAALSEMQYQEKPKCGLSKPMGLGETCTLEVGHRGPCDHNEKCRWCGGGGQDENGKCPKCGGIGRI